MNLSSFLLLSPLLQLFWALRNGTYLAQRKEGIRMTSLYHCLDGSHGFFVEVIEQAAGLEVLRSFSSSTPIEGYALDLLPPERESFALTSRGFLFVAMALCLFQRLLPHVQLYYALTRGT